MIVTALDTGGLERIHEERDADVLVLRGEAMATFVAAATVVLGRPLDTKHAPAMHGVKRSPPLDLIYRDAQRDWYLGEPMPAEFSAVQAELQRYREQVWQLEGQLSEARTVLDHVERVLTHTQALTK
jgi:hypothetical protein